MREWIEPLKMAGLLILVVSAPTIGAIVLNGGVS